MTVLSERLPPDCVFDVAERRDVVVTLLARLEVLGTPVGLAKSVSSLELWADEAVRVKEDEMVKQLSKSHQERYLIQYCK